MLYPLLLNCIHMFVVNHKFYIHCKKLSVFGEPIKSILSTIVAAWSCDQSLACHVSPLFGATPTTTHLWLWEGFLVLPRCDLCDHHVFSPSSSPFTSNFRRFIVYHGWHSGGSDALHLNWKIWLSSEKRLLRTQVVAFLAVCQLC